MLGAVARAGRDRPLLVVFEDLHWADRSTLELVTLLVRGLHDTQVLLVLTYRTDELHRSHPLRRLVGSWDRSRSVRRLQLERLPREEVAAQLEGINGSPPEPDLVELVFERSDGNPFLVEEVAGAVLGGADPGALAPSLHDVLLARAEHLSDDARHVLRMVSAAGSWAPDELVAAVAVLEEERLYAALREAVEQQLLIVHASGRGYAFRHSLARDALYEDLLPGERVRLARGVRPGARRQAGAGRLRARGRVDARVPLARRARHAAGAGGVDHRRPPGGGDVRAFGGAAALRARAGAVAELPRRGRDDRPGRDRVRPARRRGGAARRRCGAGASLLDEALLTLGADGDPVRRAELLEVRATVLRDLGRGHEAVTDAQAAVALLPEDPPSAARARVLSVLAQLHIHADDMPSAVQ